MDLQEEEVKVMLKKIYKELVAIRKELQGIRNSMDYGFIKKNDKYLTTMLGVNKRK